MGKAALALYQQHTGRTVAPGSPRKEAWLVVGRRGGKSLIAALVAVFLACFRDYRKILAPGERGTVMVIAADRRQARVVFRYIVGFLDTVPMLTRMVESRTKETIDLTNRVTIEVHTANFRAVRGYTVVAAICDEIAELAAAVGENGRTAGETCAILLAFAGRRALEPEAVQQHAANDLGTAAARRLATQERGSF